MKDETDDPKRYDQELGSQYSCYHCNSARYTCRMALCTLSLTQPKEVDDDVYGSTSRFYFLSTLVLTVDWT